MIALLLTSIASAAVTNVSVSTDGVSTFLVENTGTEASTQTYTIFGGNAGAGGSCASPSNTSVCNSCEALDPCNGVAQCAQRSIHRDLQFTVTMTVDSVPTNPVAFVQWGTAAGDELSQVGTKPTPVAGEPFAVTLKWGDICAKAEMNSDCTSGGSDDDISSEFTVGVVESGSTVFASGASQKFTIKIRAVDAAGTLVTPTLTPDSNTGFSDFKVLAGDSKVYINDVHRGSTGPFSASTKWQAMRVYYGKPAIDPYNTDPPDGGDFCSDIDYAGGNYADLPVETKETVDTRLTKGLVDGLENEATYIFNIASVDEATIVSGFLDPAQLTALTDERRYVARPGEVVGLLANKQCFIATAAFGSQMESHVQTLRQFRNEFLVTNSLGRKFVKTYYKYSPPIAEFIAQNEFVKTLVRWALWPVILFAEVSLAFGFPIAISVFAFGLLGLLRLVIKRRRMA